MSSAAVASAEQMTSQPGGRAETPVFVCYGVAQASWVDHGSTVVTIYTTSAVDTRLREASIV